MNAKKVAIAALVAVTTTLLPFSVRAQESPARTFQPGFWQPVARYDSSRPTRIRLVNRTGETLLYNLTAERGSSNRLFAGQSTILENVAPDSYIILYSEDKAEQLGVPVAYNVSVSGNLVTATVTRSAIAPGEQTLHLHPNGGIFVY